MVNEKTRERILEIARQLTYTVDKNASNLRTRLTHTLALLFFEDPTADESNINPFFLSMQSWITRTCSERGYDLLISFQQMSHNWHAEYAESRKADGLILPGYGDYTAYRGKLDTLLQSGTHFVRWGGRDGRPAGRLLFRWNRDLLAPGSAVWYRRDRRAWSVRYNRSADGVSLQEEKADPNSLYHWYRKLLALRHARPVMAPDAGGSMEWSDLLHGGNASPANIVLRPLQVVLLGTR